MLPFLPDDSLVDHMQMPASDRVLSSRSEDEAGDELTRKEEFKSPLHGQ